MSEDRPQTQATAKWISSDRLAAILSTYGAAAERWPDDERDAALALIARSDTARAMRDSAAGLDAALDSLQPPAPSDMLDARVRRLVPPRDEVTSTPRRLSLGVLFPGWRWAPIAAGALGVALIGAVLMLMVPSPDGPAPMPVAAVTDPVVLEDDAPGLLAGVALVDPVAPEPLAQEDLAESGDFTDADLGIDSSAGFTGDGSTTLAVGGLALE